MTVIEVYLLGRVCSRIVARRSVRLAQTEVGYCPSSNDLTATVAIKESSSDTGELIAGFSCEDCGE